MTKTKILIITDSARIHTGLGENCRLVFKELMRRFPDKYELLQIGWFDINPSEQVPWNVMHTIMHPKGNGIVELDDSDKYGQKTFEGVLAKFKPDIVWCSGDIWCFDHLISSPNRNTFRLVLYYTIDGAPYFGTWLEPGLKSDWGQKLLKADEVVVWSEFGKEVLQSSCPELKNKDIKVIYHPMDVSRFRHLSREQKVQERRKLYNNGIDVNGFILGYVGRNQFRKQNYKLWEIAHYVVHGDYIECNQCNRVTIKEWDLSALKTKEGRLTMYEEGYDYSECWYCRSKDIVAGKPISDFWLWQHIPVTDPGYNMELHHKMWKIRERIVRTSLDNASKGLPPDKIAEMISTWDGMLYTSGGEGFGIPAFEAQMCGVPLIYNNYSSHVDFAKEGGLPIRCTFIPEMGLAIHRSVSDTGDAVKQVLWAYRNREAFEALGMKGRINAMKHNTISVSGQWERLFSDMMNKPVAIQGATNVYSSII
jgi:glycosyltransferase involved in cell wall biosynthesis